MIRPSLPLFEVEKQSEQEKKSPVQYCHERTLIVGVIKYSYCKRGQGCYR